MALVLADRVQETTTTTGTGTVTLAGAVSGYQSFAAIGNANTTYYTIADQSGTNWEVGIGTYTSSGTTLSRDTVLSSSNSGSLVNFGAGTKNVFCDYPAGKAVSTDTLAYPPAIGGTTPSTGTFTTLTAQTEVLKGTGNNFFNYSQDYTQSVWSKTGSTITAASTTAPDGTTTGQTLNEDTSTGQHNISRGGASEVLVVGETYTMSVYAKQAGRSVIFIQSLITFAKSYFDIASGTVLSSGSGMTSTITSVGNGWYRCAVTFVCDSTNNSIRVIAATTGNGVQTYTGTGIASVYFWGAQMEMGSSATTYIPTTTVAVYGTPSLSFSGVAGLGLQSDGSLYVSPAGTGALQAQKTDSSATGGNARGANAVDWQTYRFSAGQVASGQYSVVNGGYQNTASGFNAGIVSGNSNVASNSYAFIGTGTSNTSSGAYSGIVSGASNIAAGFYNFIGAGFTNSGTASAAVTTQSGTMNGTTAVTLSGSNASIKVGQIISGTSINSFPPTYVAAISGTSLTLSQNASGSSTSTLSFYTPHGVVVGGGNNQATGSYSFIGGGGDAGTAANGNSAAGDWSTVVGGQSNTIASTGSYATVGGGFTNTANSTYSTVVGGRSNSAFNDGSTALGGYQNAANASMATVIGRYAISRGLTGSIAFSACSAPIAAGTGISQSSLFILARQTTDATATVLASDATTAGSTNQVILPNNSAYYIRGSVIAGVTGAGNTKAWTFECAIKRGSGVGTTAIVGTAVLNTIAQDAGASAWTIALSADTTNGGLSVIVTGQASTTIRWVCKAESTEMTY